MNRTRTDEEMHGEYVRVSAKLPILEKIIETALPDGMAFVLLIFNPEDRDCGYGAYVSNAKEADVIQAAREFADNLEAGTVYAGEDHATKIKR